MMEDNPNADICRVCRCEGTPEKPLYHPCICTGSIKFIHQECLVQWLRYSDKEFCELCNHRFSFIPIYSPDMPKRLPIKDIMSVLLRCLFTAARYWFQYTLVAAAWLGLIPLTAYRIYMFLFNYSWSDVMNFTVEFYKPETLFSDGFYGCCVVMCTLCTFIFVLWLREQIIRVGAPDWLERPFERNALFRLLMRDQNVEPNANNDEDDDEDEGDDDEDNDDEEEDNDEDEDERILDGEVAEINNNTDNNLMVENDAINENENGQENLPAVVQNAGPAINPGGVPEARNGLQLGRARLPAAQNNNNNNPVVAQDWNPVIEWDRGAEDITWERVFGLDGTFAFLENVFWVITLNTLFILGFAFFPYHIGNVLFKRMNVEIIVSPHFDRFIIIFMGYIMIGAILFLMHIVTSLTQFNRIQRFFGFCYIIVKVALLVTLEIGLFPTLIGWWLDICSLPLFDSTLLHRIENFFASPGTSLFIHWLVGLFCIFYFVSFIIMVKEIVRPGLLWFVRNLNDPNFNPINEMINLSIFSHIKRCVYSLIVFGTTILIMIYLPVGLIQNLMPKFLPYNNISSNDSPFTELLIELFLFQLVLPALIDHNDHNNSRKFIKLMIRGWCQVMAYLLDLKSYLLGDNNNNNNNNGNNNDNNNDQANEENIDDASSHNQMYRKPKLFYIRVTFLLVAFWATLLFFGAFTLTVPVLLGRALINFYFGDIRVNEFNTAACGIYAIVIFLQMISVVVRGISRGWTQIITKVTEWIPILCKLAVAAILLLGVIPLLIGLLFEVVLLLPLRVPLGQTPVFYLYQDWAFGVLLTNVICAITMMTDLQFKETLEQVYNNGLANINLRVILFDLAFPNISIIGMILALPYVFVNTLFPLFGATIELQNLVNRRIHSILFVIALLFFLVKYQINKFTRFYEHIRNDKYLVGRRLVNYEPINRSMVQVSK
ncbi:E3 ubiquitin-protein ligase MARCHF6 [Dermatophagoides farinae]|uniref:E3 ubiquitin-protein ligase MARCHF6 n=1 Tax=Dermatophagoides farinae TaxID=6954 RepID=A0A922LBB1_DERFA|nr:E3 ubiquitin-protein ligase march6 [Dermatophagoides farinae]